MELQYSKWEKKNQHLHQLTLKITLKSSFYMKNWGMSQLKEEESQSKDRAVQDDDAS